MTKLVQERNKLGRDYVAAFKAANKRTRAPEVEYYNGWFFLRYPGSPPTKFRPKTLEKMKNTLIARAAAQSAPAL